MGQLSDPYDQSQDDGLEITLSGLPEDEEEETDEDGDPDLSGDVPIGTPPRGSKRRPDEEEDDDDLDDITDESDSDDEADDDVDEDDEEEEGEEGEDEEGEDEEEVAYDLSEWEDEQLDRLFNLLDEEEIGYLWDGEELFVRASDEQVVDELLEAASNPDALDSESDDGDAGAQLLGELFVVADILRSDPDDHEASVTLLDLSRAAEDADPPYGLAEPEWDKLRERVEAVAELLRAEGDLDEDAVLEAAAELRSALRPYV